MTWMKRNKNYKKRKWLLLVGGHNVYRFLGYPFGRHAAMWLFHFYLLDYVTSTEIFQIGDRKRKITWALFILIFMWFNKAEFCFKKI